MLDVVEGVAHGRASCGQGLELDDVGERILVGHRLVAVAVVDHGAGSS